MQIPFVALVAKSVDHVHFLPELDQKVLGFITCVQ